MRLVGSYYDQWFTIPHVDCSIAEVSYCSKCCIRPYLSSNILNLDIFINTDDGSRTVSRGDCYQIIDFLHGVLPEECGDVGVGQLG